MRDAESVSALIGRARFRLEHTGQNGIPGGPVPVLSQGERNSCIRIRGGSVNLHESCTRERGVGS